MKAVFKIFISILFMLLLFLPQSVSAQDVTTENDNIQTEVIEPENEEITDPQPECEHSFSDYVYDDNATCFADGTKTAVCDNGCGETDTVTASGTRIILSKPEMLTATQTTSQITINWSSVKGATGYDIYYRTTGNWTKFTSITSGNSFTFTNLRPGLKTNLAVRAFAVNEGKRITSSVYTTIYTGTKNSAPASVTSTQTSSQITLNWSASKGADGYIIYYMRNGLWTVATALVKGTSVTYKNLSPGITYTFAVRPVLWTSSALFGEFATHITSTKTAAPKTKVTIISKGKISVSWNSVSGAEGYQLYYKINNGKYNLYRIYAVPQKINYTLQGDRYYTFAVRAYKRAGGRYIFGDYEPVGAHIGKEADRVVINPNSGLWYLTLVNKQRELPLDYSVKLAYIPDGYQMDYRAASYYNKMYSDALKEGIYLNPVSAYRSRSFQQEIFDETVEDYIYGYGMTRKEAERKTATEVLYPGTSEHNLGLAVDIGSSSGYFADSAAYRWLQKNAHKYGFIERYTASKQSVTGIIPEAWHWRYVGAYHATKIKQSGLCLEEYLAKYNLIP